MLEEIMKIEEIYTELPFVDKEDLQVWPDTCIEQLKVENVRLIMDYLSKRPVSGAEPFLLDLPAFIVPFEEFKLSWEKLAKKYGRNLAKLITEEEITPSDEF